MNRSSLDFRQLALSERIQLVEDIWDSIMEETPGGLELTPSQRAELDRRWEEHQADPASGVPWEQVRASLFKGKT